MFSVSATGPAPRAAPKTKPRRVPLGAIARAGIWQTVMSIVVVVWFLGALLFVIKLTGTR